MDIYEIAKRIDDHKVTDIDKMLDLPNEEMGASGICVVYILPDNNLYIVGSDNLIIPIEVADPSVMGQVNIEMEETGTGLIGTVVENKHKEFDSPHEVDGDAYFYDESNPDYAEEIKSYPDYKENVIYVQNNPEDKWRKWFIGSRFPSVSFRAKLGEEDWCTGIVFDKKDII